VIVAQTTTMVLDWERILWERGPMYALFLLFLLALVYYGPKILSSHLNCMESFAKAMPRIARSLEIHEDAHDQLGLSLHHIAEAGKEATSCPDVRKHLNNAQIVLRGGETKE
jgi:hypothetical protein